MVSVGRSHIPTQSYKLFIISTLYLLYHTYLYSLLISYTSLALIDEYNECATNMYTVHILEYNE